jgi:hypothetical protein
MTLDIRVPIGLMFGIIGVVLTVFGYLSDPQLGVFPDAHMYERSLGINVNLVWGWLLVGFAAIMLGLADRAKRRSAPPADSAKPG